MIDTDALIADFARRVHTQDAVLPIVHKAFGSRQLGERDAALLVALPPPPPPLPVAPPMAKVAPPLVTRAETGRLEAILCAAAKVALQKIFKLYGSAEFYRNALPRLYEAAFETAVRNQCDKILNAAKVKPATRKAIDEQKEQRKEARKALAFELRDARQKLRTIQWRIANAEQEAKKLVEDHAREVRKAWAQKLINTKRRHEALRAAFKSESQTLAGKPRPEINDLLARKRYQEIPLPAFTAHPDGHGLPDLPGIYFLWAGDVIEYVGKSVSLCNRLRLGGHHVMKKDHRISFIFVDQEELTWAECYYIGAVRPQLNFGVLASHYKPRQFDAAPHI